MKVKQDEGAGSAGTEGKGCSKGWHRLTVKMSKAMNGVSGGLDSWWKASQAEGTGGARVLKEVLSSLSENQQGGQRLWSSMSKVESDRDEVNEIWGGADQVRAYGYL